MIRHSWIRKLTSAGWSEFDGFANLPGTRAIGLAGDLPQYLQESQHFLRGAVMIKKMLSYPKVASAVAVALICAGVRITAWLLGTPWSGPSASSAAVAFSLAIFLAFAIVAVVERRRARILADGRLLTAMDFYAEGQIARDRLARHLRPAASTCRRIN